MANVSLSPYLTQQFFNNAGAFNAGGFLYTYSGGTVTPIATYTDFTGVTPNANPIVLNARGEVPAIWLLPNTSYKFVLTDPAGNVIWTRDQVTVSQLLTLFGGVDTGVSNAYVLNFTWPYSGYQNGEVIYFIPSNSNTGPSTLNVNGLGVIPIVNINGSALGANQIVSGATTEVMYYNGSFQLLSIGSFTGVTIGTFGTETPLASAATTDLGTATAHVVLITGTATISSFGTSANVAAPIYVVRFASSLILTYNASSMILPGGASIVTLPGDACLCEYLGGGAWKVLIYQTQGGQQNAKIKPADTVITSNATLTADPDLQSNTLAIGRYSFELYLVFDSVAAGAGFKFTNDGTALDSRGLCPALETGFVNAAAVGPTAQTFYGATVTYSTVSTSADGNQVLFKGSLLVGTAGTFGISWAQATSNASATTLRAGSYLILTLLNTGTSSNQVQHVYNTAGSGVETVPTGFTTLTLEVWGGGGGGGTHFNLGSFGDGGGGGGSGAYVRSVISVAGLGGDTVAYTVGAAGLAATSSGGASTAAGGTLPMAAISAGGGTLGGSATSGNPGAGGAGGVATGGTTVNQAGNSGGGGQANPGFGLGGPGGAGISGIFGGSGPGGFGGGPSGGASSGAGGLIIFTYD